MNALWYLIQNKNDSFHLPHLKCKICANSDTKITMKTHVQVPQANFFLTLLDVIIKAIVLTI
jgi:hypothetical protein